MTAQSPWQFFTLDELRCKCGACNSTGAEMNDAFMQKIVQSRIESAFPFIVTSAYRCPKYNAQVSYSGLCGAHTTGKAIDIAVRGGQAYLLLKMGLSVGFSGIGVSQKGASRFIHIDDCTDEDGLPRPMIWSY